MKTATPLIITRIVLLLTVILFSGCVVPSPEPASGSADPVVGQTGSVILVPVLILPPSDNQPGKDQGSAPGPVPPVQSTRDWQTSPARTPVRL